MKKATIALVLTVFAFAATTALAQAGYALRADVPIDFSVDGRHYAAGPYELRAINSSTIKLSNMKTGDTGFARIGSPDQAKAGWNTVLRFAVDGERAYLISLTNGDGMTWKVHVADRDLEASRKANSNVTVALK